MPVGDPCVDLRALASYLVSCSANSLDAFFLSRLDQASELERKLRDLIRELSDAAAAAQLADLLRQHGEELIATNAAVASQPKRSEERQPWEPPFNASNCFFLHGPDPRGIDPAAPFTTIDPGDPAHYLSSAEFDLLHFVARVADQDGWTPRIAMEQIAKYMRRATDSARHVKQICSLRRILEVEYDESQALRGAEGDGKMPLGFDEFPEELRKRGFRPPVVKFRKPKSGETKAQRQLFRLRIISPVEWQAMPELKGKAPEPKKPLISAEFGRDSSTLHLPGLPPINTRKPPIVEYKDRDTGSVLAQADPPDQGNMKNRFPIGTGFQDFRTLGKNTQGPSSAAPEAPTLGKNTQGATPEPAIPAPTLGKNTQGAPPEPKKVVTLGKNTQGPTRRIPVYDAAGKPVLNDDGMRLVVEVPIGEDPAHPIPLYKNNRVEQDVLKRPHAAIIAHFEGIGRTLHWELPPPKHRKLEPELEQIVLRRAETGTWEKAKRELERLINPHSFSTWIRPTHEEGFDQSDVLVVRVPNGPMKKYLADHYRPMIRNAVGAAMEKKPMWDVKFVVAGQYDIVLPEAVPAEQARKAAAR